MLSSRAFLHGANARRAPQQHHVHGMWTEEIGHEQGNHRHFVSLYSLGGVDTLSEFA